jgi:hypothetical protein
MSEHTPSASPTLVTRREAVRRVGALLGGVALVGGSALLTACDREQGGQGRAAAAADGKVGDFTPQEIALLDEVADTILPTTARSPGAKAAQTGAFMALMVSDAYSPRDRQAFRTGMRQLDERARDSAGAPFMQATPDARLALLTALDREQHEDGKRRETERAAREQQGGRAGAQAKAAEPKEGDKFLPDARQQNAPSAEVGAGAAEPISEDAPRHWFRMMKELALLGYFTSEIGYTKAMRYVESPGRFDPCAAYAKGEPAWAPHA